MLCQEAEGLDAAGADNQPRWIIAQIFDRTEEHTTAEQARESEQQLQAILDNSSAVIFVKDLLGRYIMVNRRFEQLHRLGHHLARRDSRPGDTFEERRSSHDRAPRRRPPTQPPESRPDRGRPA